MIYPVTVLMAVYNGQRWLAESIESVLGQTMKQFEFLILNDGSTDDTGKIIETYKRIDDRIRTIKKPKSGLTDSLNQGLGLAQGKWIARLDADDVCENNRLKEQYEFVQKNSAIVLLGSGIALIDKHSRVFKKYSFPRKKDQLLNRLLNFQSYFAHSSAFFNLKASKSVGGYRSRIVRAQDTDLWLRLLEIGDVSCHPLQLVKIRKHPDQLSEEGEGERQASYAFVSVCSYHLRKLKKPDPVQSGVPDYIFETYKKHIRDGLESDGLFKYNSFLRKIKYKIKSNFFFGFFQGFCLAAFNPKYILRYITLSHSNHSLAKKLTCQWLEKTNE